MSACRSLCSAHLRERVSLEAEAGRRGRGCERQQRQHPMSRLTQRPPLLRGTLGVSYCCSLRPTAGASRLSSQHRSPLHLGASARGLKLRPPSRGVCRAALLKLLLRETESLGTRSCAYSSDSSSLGGPPCVRPTGKGDLRPVNRPGERGSSCSLFWSVVLSGREGGALSERAAFFSCGRWPWAAMKSAESGVGLRSTDPGKGSSPL